MTVPQPLQPGEKMPDFFLSDEHGRRADLSAWRGEHNLVMLFTGGSEPAEIGALAAQFAGRAADFDAENTHLLVIAPRLGWDGALLDADGAAHRQAGALEAAGQPAAAVFVTDRFGSIYAEFSPRDANWPPAITTLLDWVQFIEIQCPE